MMKKPLTQEQRDRKNMLARQRRLARGLKVREKMSNEERKARDAEKARQRKLKMIEENGGTPSQLRNAETKAQIRDEVWKYVLDQVKSRHIPMAEITEKSQDFQYRAHGKRQRISAVVIREIVEEMEQQQLVTRYLDGNIMRVAPCSRNELDDLFAPVPKFDGPCRWYDMDEFEPRSGGLGAKVDRGYRSYHENASWPAAGGW